MSWFDGLVRKCLGSVVLMHALLIQAWRSYSLSQRFRCSACLGLFHRANWVSRCFLVILVEFCLYSCPHGHCTIAKVTDDEYVWLLHFSNYSFCLCFFYIYFFFLYFLYFLPPFSVSRCCLASYRVLQVVSNEGVQMFFFLFFFWLFESKIFILALFKHIHQLQSPCCQLISKY